MEYIHIAAVQKQGQGIGYKNELLFQITSDMKYFKEQTTGHVVIMGRKTFESIGRPLSGRINIVLTQKAGKSQEHISSPSDSLYFCNTWYCALDLIEQEFKSKTVFIIGGQKVYQDSLSFTKRLFLTEVEDCQKEIRKADAFYPAIDTNQFKLFRVTEWTEEKDRKKDTWIRHRSLEYRKI